MIRCLDFEPKKTVEGKIATEAKANLLNQSIQNKKKQKIDYPEFQMYLNQAKEIQRMTEVLG